MKDTSRGTGRTTQQIKNAPQGALYVCKTHGFISYARPLARSLGRDDLTFTHAGRFGDGCYRGTSYPVVFDHDHEVTACDLFLMYGMMRAA